MWFVNRKMKYACECEYCNVKLKLISRLTGSCFIGRRACTITECIMRTVMSLLTFIFIIIFLSFLLILFFSFSPRICLWDFSNLKYGIYLFIAMCTCSLKMCMRLYCKWMNGITHVFFICIILNSFFGLWSLY